MLTAGAAREQNTYRASLPNGVPRQRSHRVLAPRWWPHFCLSRLGEPLSEAHQRWDPLDLYRDTSTLLTRSFLMVLESRRSKIALDGSRDTRS